METQYWKRVIAILVAILVALAMLVAAPALAGVPSGEPGSCTDSADYSSWGDNCWVSTYGGDPDTVSDFTTGIQTIVHYEYWLGSIDGWYGSASKSATQQYQSSRGLTADGIVGTSTWNGLKTELTNYGTWNGWTYYDWHDNNAVKFRKQVSGDQYWKVISNLTQQWQWLDRSRST